MESLGNALNVALNLDVDLTEEEGNKLASAIMESEQARQKESVLDIAIALCNIGQGLRRKTTELA